MGLVRAPLAVGRRMESAPVQLSCLHCAHQMPALLTPLYHSRPPPPWTPEPQSSVAVLLLRASPGCYGAPSPSLPWAVVLPRKCNLGLLPGTQAPHAEAVEEVVLEISL